jgi:hypothetical protein
MEYEIVPMPTIVLFLNIDIALLLESQTEAIKSVAPRAANKDFRIKFISKNKAAVKKIIAPAVKMILIL